MKKTRNPGIRTRRRLVAAIPEERILQLSNDVSEDIASGSTAEWRAVALYFRKVADDDRAQMVRLRDALRGVKLAGALKRHAEADLNQWLKENSGA